MEALVNPSQAFWRGKRVLLTGHTGFKGAWLFHWLTALGAEVRGLALAPDSAPSLAQLTGIAGDAGGVIGDIRDRAGLYALMGDFQPEIVLHLAAQALVRASYHDPLETFSSNVMGTLHVLDAASRCLSARAAVIVTTDKCYENREWIWPYRENEALGGHDPYSASKACAEIATAAWRASLSDMRQYDRQDSPLHIATARAGNVFGGGDWAVDRLVPDFFRTIASGEELHLRNPNAKRPWQHVLEPLCGYLLLAEALYRGEAQDAWNFGPPMDDVQPVSFIAERLFKAENRGRTWHQAEGFQPHEATFLALDASKARTELHWQPRLPLREGLDWTYEWYTRHAAGEDALLLIREHVERYMALGPVAVK